MIISLRLGRPARATLISALALAVLPAAPATAADTPTPHLDAVERTLREVSPGLDGEVWERTSGNRLDSAPGDPAGWLLQTPGCWGDASCTDRAGTRKLLARMTDSISRATRTVDISTLAPFPDGAFQDAIATGLRSAVAAGHRIKVRVLVGAAPVYHLNVLPSKYRDDLRGRLGAAADDVTLNVASMTTSKTAFSWNHSKLLVVDGASAMTGGINDWKGDYLDTAHPVTDVDLALTGPAAGTAGRYLDRLWAWTCDNKANPAYVWYAASGGADCMAAMERDTNPRAVPATGDVPVIAVGGLGVGIQDTDPASTWRPALPATSDTRCGIGLHDNTNGDRDYDTVNPEESALRSLISSATDHIEISQQDLNATCPPLPRYDTRVYDALAAKLAAGVKVRIVVSDPANRGAVGSGGYSQIKSLSEISDVLRARLTRLTGDDARATGALCGNLQLASFRAAPSARWADGHPYAQHHKLISVDGSAFYIGSKNLYPAWLQDFGYIVESPAAAKQLDTELLTPQWTHSKETATVDYTRGLCDL
ncbi:phospholipase D-like domain-containing protein [Streptomyces sp. LP11]|uniref:Phospholipase D-like domain-containing protein n=1 Tax=Streptomyces pyxinicus TaxID=2970331 RepID=A0ABT2B5T6_9ACTN|nr:phospholipase D-like domain-containing protein [Streptomyces sp. LP11]MCS0603884.1 phospholipase D-like domain-containing protein [Streptomyces sp. LP11]